MIYETSYSSTLLIEFCYCTISTVSIDSIALTDVSAVPGMFFMMLLSFQICILHSEAFSAPMLPCWLNSMQWHGTEQQRITE